MNLHIQVEPEEVRRLVASYLQATRDDPGLVALARSHGGLPFWQDFGGALLLTPDGAVLGTDWERPGFVEPLTNIRPHRELLHAARGWAARTYPTLLGLAPERPDTAVACRTCDGTGRIPGLGEEHSNVRCGCGGLGWLPEEPEAYSPLPPSRWQKVRAQAEALSGRLLVWWSAR
jgi:hypothetical protein